LTYGDAGKPLWLWAVYAIETLKQFETIADGEVTRMTRATLPNKPLNVGRGLRLSVAAWQSRRKQCSAPKIASCHFEAMARSAMRPPTEA
jgi:hypothetical protein